MYLEPLEGWKKKFVITLWVLAVITVIAIIFLFYSISKDNLPTFEQLENSKYKLSSIVYDAEGRELGKYYIENRENIEYDSINPYLIKALLSTEDSRFYSHSGIDFKAIFRVLGKTVLMRRESSGGGSTISQQLAKLLFRRPDLRNLSKFQKAKKLLNIKFKEWITAVKLEKSYTKEEIIAMYLNKFDFIYGAHGIQAASNIYFGKDQNDLDITEAAMIVGMLKNPALYNPIKFTDKAKTRRNIVLQQLYKYKNIEKLQLDSLKETPLNISNFKRESHDTGPAPYFRMELKKWLKKLFAEKNIKKPDGTDYNIYTDGLKIYSTIDLDYQRNAEKAVFDHMKELQSRYWKVWRGMNPLRYKIESNKQY
ncbi:MAG TPA: penicillin-binding protein, partial [Bacteroidetes bacterium]|nr:penicillin-binding protein [Bacteroidota bacterium]